MNRSRHILLTGVCALTLWAAAAGAEQPARQHGALHLSPALLELLRAEMRELLAGTQALAGAIATGEWHEVATTSQRIQASYILDQKLTAAQREELAHALPEHFQRLDADFHRQAGRLGAAAVAHDAQLTAFHYYRLIESCTTCHAEYATGTFPGFARAAPAAHAH